MKQTLRKAGGSLVMTIPKAFVNLNNLKEGSQVELAMSGKKMVVEVPSRPHYKLSDLLKETQTEGLPMVKGWDEIPDLGQEKV
ncbi:AbrB/MazE/SpoVT family DNA-binding domain-containing protein [Limnobacter sp.]|uniref:AbrB/MazE/SpoVT family DNA-binding domain-containing protein n=1 Tax=Limnobacter sp. TaxID=2003368 RepID=UPI0035116195